MGTIPIFRHMRATRMATSPRFATRTRRNTALGECAGPKGLRGRLGGRSRGPRRNPHRKEDPAVHAYQLQREVPMFPRGPGVPLRPERVERLNQGWPSLRRLDHIVEVSELRSYVRVRELPLVLPNEVGLPLLWVRCCLDILLEHDVYRTLRSHHRELRGGPRDVYVPADVLRGHHVVGAAVRLSRDHRELRDRRLRERVQ